MPSGNGNGSGSVPPGQWTSLSLPLSLFLFSVLLLRCHRRLLRLLPLPPFRPLSFVTLPATDALASDTNRYLFVGGRKGGGI